MTELAKQPDHEEPMTVRIEQAGSLVGIVLCPDMRPHDLLLAGISPEQARQQAAALLNAADGAGVEGVATAPQD